MATWNTFLSHHPLDPPCRFSHVGTDEAAEDLECKHQQELKPSIPAPPPTSPSLDFPHTCPSSPPPYLTSGHTLRARPPSPMLPFSSQDEVVEDLDRDHQQELKRIVFSLELKRIR